MMTSPQHKDFRKMTSILQPNPKHDNLINTLFLYLDDKDIFYDEVNQIYVSFGTLSPLRG